MKFKLEKTSVYNASINPLPENSLVCKGIYTRVVRRIEKGTKVRIEETREGFFIEVGTLEDLLALTESTERREVVIISPEDNICAGIPVIEIYDDYRE